jgi:PAS domain S-box-containing protein
MRPMRVQAGPATGYAVAVVGIGLAALARYDLQSILGGQSPFLLFVVAVLASAGVGGLGPGLFATVLGGLTGQLLFVAPGLSGGDTGPAQMVRLAMFLVVGSIASGISEAMHRSMRRLREESARRREADEFHAILADLTSDFAFLARVEPGGRLTTTAVTEGFSKTLGYTLGELNAAGGWRGITHPDDRAEADAILARLLAGETVCGRVRQMARDGRLLHVEFLTRPIRDSEGRVARLVGASRDITERVRAAEELERSRRLFERITAATPGLIYLFDLVERRNVYVNDRLVELLGHTPDEVRALGPRFVEELLHPDDRATVAQGLTRFQDLQDGDILEYDVRYRHREGGYRWLRTREVVFERDGDGRVRLILGLAQDLTTIKEAEAAARRSAEQYRLATEAMAGLVHDHDLASGRVHRSAGLKALLGFDPGEVSPTADWWVERIHPEDRERRWRRAAGDGASDGGGVREAIYRVRHRDGHYIHVEDRTLVLTGPDGQPTRRVGVTTDVTARVAALEELRASEFQLRQLAEAMPQIAWKTDPSGRVVYVNRRWTEFTGLDVESTNDVESLRRVTHPDDWDRMNSEWAAAMGAGREYVIQLRIRGLDGVYRWFLTRCVPVRDAEGAIVRWFGTSTDIDETKRSEEAMRESELRHRLVAEASNDAIWDWDASTDTVSWNDALERLFGYGPEEAGGGRGWWTERIHPEDRDRVLAGLGAALIGGGETWRDEYRFRKADGGFSDVIDRARIVRSASGQVVRMVGSMMDVTERKRVEQELREADRRKDEFLATLAHELRNPLAPIRNAVQVLRVKGPHEPELVWGRDVIDRQVRHMARLLDDLLDISRLTRNTLELRRERVALSDVIATALETSGPVIEAAGHRLEVVLPAEPIALDADPVRLAQVFANLLNNAAKYTDAGGRIWLTAECRGDSVEVAVQDTGIGFSEEARVRLFHMFSQATPALKRAQGGLGIGLALVRGIVELHDGEIEAHSEGPGRGSRFTVRLPVAEMTTTKGAASVPTGSIGRARGRRVLVADDMRDSADTLARMLVLLGHEVRTVYDGVEAVEELERFEPDVVLLDIGMPRLNGYEAARRIRQRLGSAVRLIALTGWGQYEDRQRSREAGFDHHLVKPVDPEMLGRLIDGAPAAARESGVAAPAASAV